MAAKKRVLIIGLDGFTWRLGRDFIAEGVMPNLAKLVESGCHGDLRSVMPFETSPAWSSFQTGCYPGKTGIFAFHGYDRRHNTIHLNSFADNAMPSLWELADRAGKRVVSLNMPVSSPPPKVNGVIIPGLLCPKLSRETVWPPEAYDKYIKGHKDYLIVNNDWRDTVREFTDQSIVTERVRCTVALEVMRDVDWDIFCVQMQSTDVMQHRVWWALDPKSKDHQPDQRKIALEFYRYCDEAIGQIIDAAGVDTFKLLVSDHGFCTAKGSVSINVWLRKHGYLQLLPKNTDNKWVAAKEKYPSLKSLARTYGRCRRVVKNIRENFKRPGSTPVFGMIDLEHMRRIIDFEKTKAFCLGGMAGLIYINGTPEKRGEPAKKLTDELLKELGPDSSNPVIAKISTGPETYGNTRTNDLLPDLVLEYREGFESRRNPHGEMIIEPREKGGTHDRQGIIIISHGANISRGTNLNGEIVDIVPTVLAYLGIPIPRHLDGKVLKAAFIKPPAPIYEDYDIAASSSVEYTDEEQARVEKQLADLGYL